MKIFITGGIGDELCVTPLIREIKRRNPDEMIRIEKSMYPSLFENSPHLNHGKIESFRRLGPFGFFEHPDKGNMARSFGIQAGIKIQNLDLEIFLTPEEIQWGEGQVAGLPRPILAIDTSANWKSRRWNPGRWAIVAKSLMDLGVTVVEMGKNGADQWGWPRHTRIPCTRLFTDKTTLRQAAAIIKACDLYAGNDSGLFHVSAAVGTPQVIIFSNKRPMARAHSTTTSLEDETEGCSRNCYEFCVRRSGFCLDRIPWESVFLKIRETLSSMGFESRGEHVR